jgi:K+-sensing histidine kinase KdpD
MSGMTSAMVSWSRLYRDRVVVLAGVALPCAISALLVPFRSSVPNTDAALVLVVVVVAVAANGHRPAGWIAAVSSAVWFDFFLTRPYERFTITRHTDIETTVLLLVVGMAVTEIAARNRKHKTTAVEEANFVARIHSAAAAVATGESATFIVMQVAGQLIDLLFLRDCRFDPTAPHHHGAFMTQDGDVLLGGLRWKVEQMGLPGREIELRVEYQGRFFGRYLMVPTPGQPVSRERRVVASALADQVGAALSARHAIGA